MSDGRVKLHVNSRGFLQCPRCKRNNRMQRITPDMVMYNTPIYCTSCKQEIIVDVVEGQVYYHKRPERAAPETK